MSDTSVTKRLRSAFLVGKASSFAEITRTFTDAVEHSLWREEGFESVPHWVLAKEGLAIRDTETVERWIKSMLMSGFVDQWVQVLDEIAITRAKPRSEKPLAERLGFERFWKLGTGNDQDRLLLRLYRERPDLYELVIKGEMTVMAAAIKAGWRKAVLMGRRKKAEQAPRLLDENQILYAVQSYFKRANDEAHASLLEGVFRLASMDGREMFVLRTIPGVDKRTARRAAKGADSVIDVIDGSKLIEAQP